MLAMPEIHFSPSEKLSSADFSPVADATERNCGVLLPSLDSVTRKENATEPVPPPPRSARLAKKRKRKTRKNADSGGNSDVPESDCADPEEFLQKQRRDRLMRAQKLAWNLAAVNRTPVLRKMVRCLMKFLMRKRSITGKSAMEDEINSLKTMDCVEEVDLSSLSDSTSNISTRWVLTLRTDERGNRK